MGEIKCIMIDHCQSAPNVAFKAYVLNNIKCNFFILFALYIMGYDEMLLLNYESRINMSIISEKIERIQH